MLDGVTCPNHRTLDGQIRELEEPYEVDNLQAMYPGGFGVAKEDCNCRCNSTQRAKWALGEDELAELQSRADYWGLDKSQEFDEFKEKYLQAAEKSSIIKSIQIEDIKSAVEGSKIRPEVAEHIGNALKKHSGTWLFNGVKTIRDKPTIVMNTNVVQAGTFGDVILELNEACIGGKTVEEIDAMFKKADGTVANSLEEGVVHEVYHAKLVAGRNYAQIVNLYDVLDSVHINSISKTALADGSECIAEIGVLLERGDDVPEDAMRHYKKYMEE